MLCNSLLSKSIEWSMNNKSKKDKLTWAETLGAVSRNYMRLGPKIFTTQQLTFVLGLANKKNQEYN